MLKSLTLFQPDKRSSLSNFGGKAKFFQSFVCRYDREYIEIRTRNDFFVDGFPAVITRLTLEDCEYFII